MQSQTFIFIGRSGCGKGTQVALLEKLLKERDGLKETIHLETGSKFREFINGEGFSNKLSHDIYKTGERQPDFLAVRFWANMLVETLRGDEHIIFDGICRSLAEAMIFTSISDFYKRKITVVHMNVSREWSRERLLARGREDDDGYGIEKRLDWFDKDVVPAIEYFGSNDKYDLITVNGEQSIEDVHKEIVGKLNW